MRNYSLFLIATGLFFSTSVLAETETLMNYQDADFSRVMSELRAAEPVFDILEADLSETPTAAPGLEKSKLANDDFSISKPQALGRGFYYSNLSGDKTDVYFLNGKFFKAPSFCNLLTNNLMYFSVIVTDEKGKIHLHAANAGENRWKAVYPADGGYYCGVLMTGVDNFTGVGKYEAVLEEGTAVVAREAFKEVAACGPKFDLDLYAAQRPSDTNFFVATNLEDYNTAVSNGFVDQFGLIGKSQRIERKNGRDAVLTNEMVQYWNPVMTTYAASADPSDLNSHPAWSFMSRLGYIFKDQHKGTVPLYRGYYENGNFSDWEVGITTDEDLVRELIYGQGWHMMGYPGYPEGVIGYVCPAR